LTAAAPAAWPLLRWSAALLVGAAAGWLCSALRTPIPWMLGPLATLALLRVAGAQLAAPPLARYLGQWLIGTALGLYFTPQVIREVGGAWYLLAAGAAFAIAVGYLSGLVLARLAALDRTTAIFACVPGGASEMMVLGERFGARGDRVAAAQSLRILIVVIVIPFAYAWAGVHGSDVYVPGAKLIDPKGLVQLLALTLVGCLVFQRLQAPNAFVLGALMVSIPVTAAEITLSAMPTALSNVGQCLLGCALGSRFQPDFLRGAHRFVAAVVASVLFAIVLSAAFGLALAWASGRPAATLVLGTAPGGIAEMSITAKVLQLGVPIVTAFHVTRIVVLLLATGPIFARLRRRLREGN
jgi:membrane AbrB-like protein